MWRLMFSRRADKELSKMDPGVRRMIVAWLIRNIDGCDNPRTHGKGLAGDKSGKWRYRVGNHRILCEIRDKKLIVLALEIGHHSEIYKR